MRFRLCLVIVVMGFMALVLAGCGGNNGAAGAGKVQTMDYSPDEESKERLQRRLDIKYSDAEAHFELAQIYRSQGLWDKAEREYNLALQFAPGHKNAQAAMTRMFLDKKDPDRSRLLADIYMNQAKPSAKASMLLGKAFESEGLDEYAYQCYDHALTLAPTSAELHRLMGYYHKRKGDESRAEESFKQSFQLDPYNSDVSGELGRMGVTIEVPRKQETVK